MGRRVQYRQFVVRDVHPVDRTVRVDPRVPLVGRDLIVDVVDLGAPFPHRNNDVALDAAWARWGRRHGAGGDPVAPVGKHLETALATEPAHDVGHLRPTLSHLHAVVPGGKGRVELIEVVDLANNPVPQLVAKHAALLLDVDPLPLMLQVLGYTVAVRPGAGKLAGCGRFDQRVPVVGGVDRGRLGRRGCHAGLDIDSGTRLGGDTGRIEQSVATDPDRVAGLRQLRNQIATIIIGHHTLDELGRQIGRFGDDPHTRLRSARACNGTADVALSRPAVLGEPDQRRAHQHDTCQHPRETIPHGCDPLLISATRSSPPSHTKKNCPPPQ